MIAIGEPLIEFNQTQRLDAGVPAGLRRRHLELAIAAARLGARTAYVTRVGDDAFGRMFLELWRSEGVDTRGVVRDPDAPTGIYFVTHGANGHEFSYLRAGSAASRHAARQPAARRHPRCERAARLRHQPGDLGVRVRRVLRRDRCRARRGRKDFLRHEPAPEALAAAASAGRHPRESRARRLGAAEPRRCEAPLRPRRPRRDRSTPVTTPARRSSCCAAAPTGCVVSDGRTARAHRRPSRASSRCDRRRRLLRRRLRRAPRRRRRSGRRRALRQRRGRARDDRLRRGRAAAASRRRRRRCSRRQPAE